MAIKGQGLEVRSCSSNHNECINNTTQKKQENKTLLIRYYQIIYIREQNSDKIIRSIRIKAAHISL